MSTRYNATKNERLQSKNEQGSALFISLIILLILTVLGLSSMNDTLMQTKMSGAMQDSNLALQTAEFAVRQAEEYIESLDNIANFDNTKHLYTATNAPQDIYDDTIWTTNKTSESGTVVNTPGFPQPRYFIELLGLINDGSLATSPLIHTYSHEGGAGDLMGFRIVARSTGAAGISRRYIESYYGKRF